MLSHLLDRANAITSCGIALSATAILLTLNGDLEFAIAAGLWAMFADQLDGIVAKQSRNRSALTAAIGKNLDGFGDLLYGAVLPALVIVMAGQTWAASFLAVLMVIAGAIRLSYFNAVGLADGRFYGLPLSYDMPLVAVIFLLRPWVSAETFGLTLTASFLVVTTLHIAPIKVKAPRGTAYFAIAGVAAVLSMLMLALAP